LIEIARTYFQPEKISLTILGPVERSVLSQLKL